MWGIFLECTEDILSVGDISRVYICDWFLTNGSRARFRRFLAYEIKYLEFGESSMWGIIVGCEQKIP